MLDNISCTEQYKLSWVLWMGVLKYVCLGYYMYSILAVVFKILDCRLQMSPSFRQYGNSLLHIHSITCLLLIFRDWMRNEMSHWYFFVSATSAVSQNKNYNWHFVQWGGKKNRIYNGCKIPQNVCVVQRTWAVGQWAAPVSVQLAGKRWISDELTVVATRVAHSGAKRKLLSSDHCVGWRAWVPAINLCMRGAAEGLT